jgi:hypothetical protein
MKDVEKLIQSVLKKALVAFAKETKCGMIDLYKGNLIYDIDGKSYEIIVREMNDNAAR